MGDGFFLEAEKLTGDRADDRVSEPANKPASDLVSKIHSVKAGLARLSDGMRGSYADLPLELHDAAGADVNVGDIVLDYTGRIWRIEETEKTSRRLQLGCGTELRLRRQRDGSVKTTPVMATGSGSVRLADSYKLPCAVSVDGLNRVGTTVRAWFEAQLVDGLDEGLDGGEMMVTLEGLASDIGKDRRHRRDIITGLWYTYEHSRVKADLDSRRAYADAALREAGVRV